MKKGRIARWVFLVIAVAINVFIIYNSCLASKESSTVATPVVEVVGNVTNTLSPGSVDKSSTSFITLVRKLFGHFSLFMVDGFFTSIATFLWVFDGNYKRVWMPAVMSALIGIFVASFSEFLQTFMKGRVGCIKDALIDSSGYLIGLLITACFIAFAILLMRISRANQEKKA